MKIKLTAVLMAVVLVLILFNSVSQSQDLDGHSIGMGPDGICISDFKSFTWEEWDKFIRTESFEKTHSDLYRCASNNWINTNVLSPAYTDEQRKRMATDIFNSTCSDILPVNKDIKGRVSVYFEICGSGFSIEEKKILDKEIQEAIKKILDKHFE